MNESSSSGAITSSFENISDVFTAHTELASEGYNCLYKAQRYGKWYVLKGLKPEFRNESIYKELLSKEFELGIKMSHPHIAQTVGKETDPIVGPCIVMEYVDGQTLKSFLATQPPRQVRLKIVRELLSAMAYYHSLQIVHRDLKPNNILITRNGHNVKIIDFGLADSDYHGVLKQPAGSERYAAPEQKEGKVAIDCRADIYAFGHILRQLFPHRYSAIYRKCVQFDRNNRFNSAEDILKRLDAHTLRNIIIALFTIIVILSYVGLWLHKTQTIDELSILPEEPLSTLQTDSSIHNQPTHSFSNNNPTQQVQNLPVAAQRMISHCIDSIFQPHWEWLKTIETSDTTDIYVILDSKHPGPFDFQLESSILKRVLQKYPQCDTIAWQLEEFYNQYYLKQLNKFNNHQLEIWDQRKTE